MQQMKLKTDEDSVVLREAIAEDLPSELPCMSEAEASEVLGNSYSVMNLLGSGGTGTVFKVRHQSSGKEFAIKILHKHLLHNRRTVERFEREAKAAIAMTHPHIAAVYDYGVGNGGVPFLVMDYMPGQTLEQLIAKSGRLHYARAIELIEQVSDAINYAHSKGVIHRDIKPSNIIVMQQDEGIEFVKLLDFGIAKALSDRCIDLTQGITQTGEIFGSPSYMAPEQCKGETVDERTDIHALGVLLYEAISGQKPFQGKNSFAVLLNVVSAKPAPFPEYIKLPPDCISTVMKCLEKDPDNRYQNASELSHDLQKIREGKRIASTFAVFMHSFVLNKAIQDLFLLILIFVALGFPSTMPMQGLKAVLGGGVGVLLFWKFFNYGRLIVVEGASAICQLNKKKKNPLDIQSIRKRNLIETTRAAVANPVLRLIWLISLCLCISFARELPGLAILGSFLSLFASCHFTLKGWSIIREGSKSLIAGVQDMRRKNCYPASEAMHEEQRGAQEMSGSTLGTLPLQQIKISVPLRLVIQIICVVLGFYLAFKIPQDWRLGNMPLGILVWLAFFFGPFVIFGSKKKEVEKHLHLHVL
jgi:tRNA A-37 threonylcarbamoyl transferase component Bud32